MNYSEMSDFDIEAAVAAIIHPGLKVTNFAGEATVWDEKNNTRIVRFCHSWADAGPIIGTNKISLDFDEDGFEPPQNAWCKASSPCGEVYYGSENEPLRAAMIVFLMMQGGDNG